jgi:hypothetical protein
MQEGKAGVEILETICSILSRCEQKDKKLHYPHEGTERAFRSWLADDLLKRVLGWPSGNVVVGERFDIRLDDDAGSPVVTIETKSLYHKSTPEEKKVFEKRLRGLASLKFAFFTNGRQWECLELLAPEGVQEIKTRTSLTVDKTSPQEIEAFFQPLKADRYLRPAGERNKSAVSKSNPPILQSLAYDLDSTVQELSDFFHFIYAQYESGEAGKRVSDIARTLFDMWCIKSLIPNFQKTLRELHKFLTTGTRTPKEIVAFLSRLGFSGNNLSVVADKLGSIQLSQLRSPADLRESLFPLYQTAHRNLCAQTAHVIVARSVIYRVGEDSGVFRRKISGSKLEDTLSLPLSQIGEEPCPALSLLFDLQKTMQGFLPNIYQRGEFDWWLIEQNERASMSAAEQAFCHEQENRFDKILQRMFRMLDGYFFGEVDVDVWRNVYQNYLPEEERQKLGGFYTPDELVDLVLDIVGYVPDKEGLCEKTIIDPACGSGAFVAAAATRLLKHLRAEMSCHKCSSGKRPAWQQSQEALTKVEQHIHAIDIHPFAAFLTTVNLVFLLLPEYVKVHDKNPNFPLDIRIFSVDALEKPGLVSPELFADVNSRIQLSRDSLKRYIEFVDEKFDYVVGNPPWGGVLKGPLAPVFDETKKKRFKDEFPAAAQGKYDIYALFMERALQILKENGTCGFVTQGSFIDKEWAAGLREKLASDTTIGAIVDLNPFGQLFFHAMNIPAITTFRNAPPPNGAYAACILSSTPKDFKGLSESEKRARVASTIREVLSKLVAGKKQVASDFASGTLVPLKTLKENATKRWDLAQKPKISVPKDAYKVSDLLEPFQGVTTGGEGCLQIFLMPESVAQELCLEGDLIHRVCKGRETTRWRWNWTGKVIFYPYDPGSRKPAFGLPRGIDALNFNNPIDKEEQEIMRSKKLTSEILARLLQHRIALQTVKYPKAAEYLIKHYDTLEQRVFEKKNIREWGKQWYEYHRPRDPRIMTAKPKIITPRLAKEVRFFLDTERIVPQDSCICLVPKEKDRDKYVRFEEKLSALLGKEPNVLDVLKYCLAFLNSPFSQEAFTTGHRPTPKGFYTITEDFLSEVPVVLPRSRDEAKSIMTTIGSLVSSAESYSGQIESSLFAHVVGLLCK